MHPLLQLLFIAIIGYVVYTQILSFIATREVNKELKEALEKYPTHINQYIKDNPDCKTDKGMKCSNCGSNHFKNVGAWGGRDDNIRLVACNHCNTRLYHVT